MVDLPGRSGFEPDDRADRADDGWGSPLPAEYGSLRAVRPDPGPPTLARPPAQARAPAQSRPRSSEGRTRRTRPVRRETSRISSLLRRIEGSPPPEPEPPPPPAAAAAVPAEAKAPEPQPAPAAPPGPAATPAPAPTPAGSGAPELDDLAPRSVRAAALDLRRAAAGEGTLAARRPPTRRPARVRSRATVRHLDVFTVARVSIIFYVVVLMAMVTASVLLWVFADVFGALPSLEKSVRTLFSLKTFVLHPATVAYYTSIGGVILCVAGTFVNVLGALVYNLIADVVGGVRVELESFSRE